MNVNIMCGQCGEAEVGIELNDQLMSGYRCKVPGCPSIQFTGTDPRMSNILDSAMAYYKQNGTLGGMMQPRTGWSSDAAAPQPQPVPQPQAPAPVPVPAPQPAPTPAPVAQQVQAPAIVNARTMRCERCDREVEVSPPRGWNVTSCQYCNDFSGEIVLGNSFPEATGEMEQRSEYKHIADAMSDWMISVPGVYEGLMPPTGSHVRAILDAIERSKKEAATN